MHHDSCTPGLLGRTEGLWDLQPRGAGRWAVRNHLAFGPRLLPSDSRPPDSRLVNASRRGSHSALRCHPARKLGELYGIGQGWRDKPGFGGPGFKCRRDEKKTVKKKKSFWDRKKHLLRTGNTGQRARGVSSPVHANAYTLPLEEKIKYFSAGAEFMIV